MSRARKRILFFARPFPPAPWVAAVRTYNMAKYLQLAGWDVEVVTLNPALIPGKLNCDALDRLRAIGVKIRFTDCRWLFVSGGVHSPAMDRWPSFYRASQKIREIVGIDDGFGWVRPALEACSNIKPGDVDIILATGSPFFTFQIAQIMAKRLSCQYVLDYRDLWNLNPHSSYKPFWPQRLLERRWLKNASQLLFVSPGCMEAMAQWTGSSERMSIVTNGFDPEEFAGIEGGPGERPVIVYAGRFYPPESNPTPILRALQRLQHARECPQFHYYGPHNRLVATEAERLGVMNSVVLHGMTERAEVLKAIKQADVAVVITTVNAAGSLADKGIVTAKVFEPLGLRTPILLIAPYQSDARMIVENADGGRAFTGDNVDGIADFLMQAKQHRKQLTFAGVDHYSWRSIGERLSQMLKGLCYI